MIDRELSDIVPYSLFLLSLILAVYWYIYFGRAVYAGEVADAVCCYAIWANKN